MDIAEACKTVHAWNDRLSCDPAAWSDPGILQGAVAEVKRYLENARGDGKPIQELRIAEHLLTTREGLRWVMPFVLSVEAIEASKRRKTMS